MKFSVFAMFGLSIQTYWFSTWIFHSLPNLDFLYKTDIFSCEFFCKCLIWTFYTVLPFIQVNFQSLSILDCLRNTTVFSHEFFSRCLIWTFYTQLIIFYMKFSVFAIFGLSIQYYWFSHEFFTFAKFGLSIQ